VGCRCPYLEHEPLTKAGWQGWDALLRCSRQLRFAPDGVAVLGLDLDAPLSLGSVLGYDAAALAELLPAAEAGLIATINNRRPESAP
jgi:hypothetical protein